MDKVKIGTVLRFIRLWKGKTLRSLVKQTRLNVCHLSQIENGYEIPDVYYHKYLRHYDLSVRDAESMYRQLAEEIAWVDGK